MYTAIKRTPQAGLVVTAAAMNSAVTGATFFVVREYAVVPTLTRLVPFEQYARRRRELGIDPPSTDSSLPSTVSPSDIRRDKILDSAVSGSITGSLLRGIRSGRSAIVPGFIMGTAVAAILQYSYNEINLSRLRYISKLNQENRTAVPKPVIRPRNSPPSPEPTETWMEVFLKTIGMTPVTDEEYIAKMKKTRDVYLKRIHELEVQLETESDRRKS
ncbi:hypothetical protein HYPSUDRAFT_194783 [Hypholoma sublateritium FD-334 SS-4]|uniref:Uncharacterized protein n=1 Tax=Hypholoma sublateritium (strain FD-334 SS-4) TaxID=945553 RepID=A0A0D2KJK9_HYPSF|nr:hypothetical protein HYPSUDRAFT_194783 [Hypholoma sublateritium FD-334 SS-4]